MSSRAIAIYNIIGGFLWGVGVTVTGFFLGKVIPDVDKYLIPIVIVIIIASILPSVIHLIKERNKPSEEYWLVFG